MVDTAPRARREAYVEYAPAVVDEMLAATPVELSHMTEYADYFADRIRDLKRRGLEEDSPAYHRYLTERRWIFSALSQVHTPEVVEVFAGFLDDNDQRRLPDLEGTLGQASASELAGMLENPPVNSSMRMDLWLEWRDRVRAGKQTYSFKGSKKRYDFQGEVLATPRTSRRPVEERSERPAVDSGDEPERTPWVPVVGALLALMLGFAFWKWKARPAA